MTFVQKDGVQAVEAAREPSNQEVDLAGPIICSANYATLVELFGDSSREPRCVALLIALACRFLAHCKLKPWLLRIP